MVSPCCLRPHGATASEIKKPTWRNTQRYSTTSAYSSTSPPAWPGCPLPSHPTTSIQIFSGAECESTRAPWLPSLSGAGTEKQVKCFAISCVMYLCDPYPEEAGPQRRRAALVSSMRGRSATCVLDLLADVVHNILGLLGNVVCSILGLLGNVVRGVLDLLTDVVRDVLDFLSGIVNPFLHLVTRVRHELAPDSMVVTNKKPHSGRILARGGHLDLLLPTSS